jgi:hypothetical protein
MSSFIATTLKPEVPLLLASMPKKSRVPHIPPFMSFVVDSKRSALSIKTLQLFTSHYNPMWNICKFDQDSNGHACDDDDDYDDDDDDDYDDDDDDDDDDNYDYDGYGDHFQDKF